MARWSVNTLEARIVLSSALVHDLGQFDIKEYVFKNLSDEISKEILNHMTITEHKDVLSDTITYTGTLSGVNTISISPGQLVGNSGNAYTASNSANTYSQIILRVVEYTKDGKVTRVELQQYDDSKDDWFKIPRIQIEE